MSWEDILKKSEMELVNKFIMFMNNTNAYEKIEILFEQPYEEMESHRKQYVQKFMNVHKDIAVLWGMLDYDNREKLVNAAIEKYGR